MKLAAHNKVVLIGCGNVAWHMAKQLQAHKNKFQIQVYNHRPSTQLQEFKTKLKCEVFDSLKKVGSNADYYIIAVTDGSVKKVVSKLTIKNPAALLVHTSGSLSVKIFGKRAVASGVLYPLQSFSKTDEINWAEVPIIIEPTDKATENVLEEFAKNFSRKIYFRTEKERLALHLAAVMSNNFTNSLFAASDDLLKEQGQSKDFQLLLPLIQKTVAKLSAMCPKEAQTGPAKRKDKVVMKKHLQLLKKRQSKNIYKELSRLIKTQQDA